MIIWHVNDIIRILLFAYNECSPTLTVCCPNELLIYCRVASPSRMGHLPASGAAGTLALRQSGGLGLKEGFMRERVAQLEADLKAAAQREGLLETEAMQVGGI